MKSGAPAAPVGLGDHAGELAGDVGERGEGAQAGRPGIDSVVADVGLGDVIEDEALVRESARELERGGELARVDEDVVGEIERGEGGDAALEVGAEHEVVVGLVLHDVADAAEFLVHGEASELVADVDRAEVDPADHAADEVVLRRELEQPLRLGDVLLRLDCDRAIECGRAEERGEVIGQEVAFEGGHASRRSRRGWSGA